MGSSHLNGQETVHVSQDESRMQVSGETSLLSQNSDEFLADEKDDILSDDSASVSDDDASIGDFGEEEDISNNEDYLQIEDVDALEANNENQKKHELCIGMDFIRPYTMNLLFHNYSRDLTRVDHRKTLSSKCESRHFFFSFLLLVFLAYSYSYTYHYL
ncbi:BnaC07g15640D [Brassica napus]|uniref:BnaC07g15640D protein n=1 Tax=Brassica napus TaxID=3708 RepID=A0A078I5S7_BRANA|nr:BnaC07g15640D [Brassica napus]